MCDPHRTCSSSQLGYATRVYVRWQQTPVRRLVAVEGLRGAQPAARRGTVNTRGAGAGANEQHRATV